MAKQCRHPRVTVCEQAVTDLCLHFTDGVFTHDSVDGPYPNGHYAAWCHACGSEWRAGSLDKLPAWARKLWEKAKSA
jgi:hypothetical protein